MVELPGQEPPRVYVHGLGATSPAYFAEVVAHPLLAGRRSLLIDVLGHGLSDRPTGFDYTLESHADALAAALARADVVGAELVAHSMGGSVAIVLAARHPRLVSRLVLVDANLDPVERTAGSGGSSGIASYSEQEFLTGGWAEVRDRAGAHWWSTMRLAGREALHRSAVHLTRGTVPTRKRSSKLGGAATTSPHWRVVAPAGGRAADRGRAAAARNRGLLPRSTGRRSC
ncbi:alpha/beta fold hydrolase [Streptomyces blattellae]|uniref:alpha/beta fold hydrolase n=1 Tax=Streptomyces blattellae TaxID=2569855 RepID=UPI001E3745FF|nr:alpha/beta fold hydrolase [Streptomyces blattellae]